MTLGNKEFRGGLSPTRTALELSGILPLPLLLVIEGYASPIFPLSTPATPSPSVGVISIREKTTWPPVVGLPVWINWLQWERVVVPILESGVVAKWRGQIQDLGDQLVLLNNVVGPGWEIVFQEGTVVGESAWTRQRLGLLYGCDPSDTDRVGGKLSSYLENLSRLIYQRAVEAGY